MSLPFTILMIHLAQSQVRTCLSKVFIMQLLKARLINQRILDKNIGFFISPMNVLSCLTILNPLQQGPFYLRQGGFLWCSG